MDRPVPRPGRQDGGAPLVSVVVPIYNSAPYLSRCLDSVAALTFRDIEVICIDDGSTDGSGDIVNSYVEKDGRFSLVRQENRGASAARNRGMSLARGEYIYFLDSDDWVDFKDLGRLLDLARRENLDQVVFAAEVHVTDFGDAQNDADLAGYARMAKSYVIPGDVADRPMSGVDMAFALMERECFNVLCMVRLIKRETLVDSGILFPEGVLHEDEFFTAALYAVSRRVVAVREKYYHRRFRPGSIMTATDNTVEHLRGCLTAERLLDEFARARFAEGSGEMKFLRARMRVIENIIRFHSRSITLGMLPPESRDGVLHDMFANDQTVRQVDLAFKSNQKALASEKARNARIEREHRKFHAQLDEQTRLLAEVRRVRDAVLKERDSLRENLDATRAVRDAALKERDTLRGNLEATRAVRDAVLKERDSLRENLDATRAVRDAVLKERDSLRENLDATRTVRDSVIKERNTLRENLDATRAVRDAALKERSGLREKLDAAQKDRNVLRENLNATRTVRDSVIKERNTLRENLDATRTVRDAALKERNSLKNTLETVRSVRDAALKERDALRTKVASAAKSLDGACAERDGLRRELNALRKVLGEIEKICGTEKGDE